MERRVTRWPDGEPGFEALRQAHVEALTGSLIDGVEHGPGGSGYVWSRGIPDPTLNFAHGVRHAEPFAWAGAAALGRGRAPAFLAQDAAEEGALRRLFEPAAAFAASWMVAGPHPAQACLPRGVRVTVGAAPAPGADFAEVFAGTSDDPAVRRHLHRTYLPALRVARGRPGLVPLHLVLHDARGPAACASLYCRGAWAGLYNVGTRCDRQGRGLGSALVAAALREARARGAALVFLQCPAGGAVEAFYGKAGFRTLYRPVLLCTESPV